jgi:ATP-dependent protease HslVU (ClpYQ) peptidase subunit
MSDDEINKLDLAFYVAPKTDLRIKIENDGMVIQDFDSMAIASGKNFVDAFEVAIAKQKN